MGMVSEEEKRGTWTPKGHQQISDSIPTLKIDPAAVAFDIDSVFADTMSLFLDIAENQYQISGIRYEDLGRPGQVVHTEVRSDGLVFLGTRVRDE